MCGSSPLHTITYCAPPHTHTHVRTHTHTHTHTHSVLLLLLAHVLRPPDIPAAPHCLRYFPTILIVIMAVFNDGAMIALSKDKVVASQTPNSWNLKNIFIMGIIYGLYLTLSSWVLYQVRASRG